MRSVGPLNSGFGTFMNTSTTLPETGELVSALADGESTSAEVMGAIQACGNDPYLLDRWKIYHVIGEVLRSPGQSVSGAESGFHARFAARLAQEPKVVGATQAGGDAAGKPSLVDASLQSLAPASSASANDRNFRWKLAAGFASLTAVSAIAWGVFGALAPTAVPQLASAPAAEQVLVDSPRGPVMRDARLEELMAAHKQLGAPSAQMPSGFLRNATFETPQTNAGR